ncbi:nucleotide-diphospho-sugar transferase [Bimuria novae-zelandiae CBS 107.79]|uniref:Nucleotide-diphospho-sugar transferase n=1 Tax=Bimuria novae-zelandiae CBS 107.79 TaxID=1447943 RepID=A0A6A5UUU9_9PLEO|nr:nucleotide-diphospho-sugar transferase [Bimuria novae-zelandiae CBS 107.79]
MNLKFRILSVSFLVFAAILLSITYFRPKHSAPPYLGSSYRSYNSTAHLPATDYAIATFLTGQAKDDDSYFVATRVLTYQLLHAESTKCDANNITFLVLCSESVSCAQKATLRADGATVVQVRDVPVNWWIHSGVTRWKEQFTKLRVFEMTEYKRILFMDADTLLTGHIDGIFDEPEVAILAPTLDRKNQVRWGESQLPSQWLFAARSDNAFTGERKHPTPPLQAQAFSAGFFLVAPDRRIFEYLLSVMAIPRRFDPFTMEQSLLNYVFRRDGRMPWRELGWRWSATWPNEEDVKLEVVSLHEKLWKTGPQGLKDMWNRKKGEMLRFHERRRGEGP